MLLGAAVGAAGLIALGLVPWRRDARDGTYQRATAERIHRAQRARELARAGVPPEGGLAVYRNDPAFRARELWDQHCARCHSFTGAGGREGPDFKDYNSRAWLRDFLTDPQGDRFMGPAHITKPMEPVHASDDELDALAELVYAQTGAPDTRPELLRAAQPLFATKDCNSCHERDGTTEGNGPNLLGRGTMAWLIDVIADPGQGRLYGKKNKMPAFGAKLSPDEIAELARFLLTEARR